MSTSLRLPLAAARSSSSDARESIEKENKEVAGAPRACPQSETTTTAAAAASSSSSSSSSALAEASKRLSSLLAEREDARARAAASLARAERLERRAAGLRQAAAEAVAGGGEGGEGEARKLLEHKAQVSRAAAKARLRAAANRELAAKLAEAAGMERAEMDRMADALEAEGGVGVEEVEQR